MAFGDFQVKKEKKETLEESCLEVKGKKVPEEIEEEMEFQEIGELRFNFF